MSEQATLTTSLTDMGRLHNVVRVERDHWAHVLWDVKQAHDWKEARHRLPHLKHLAEQIQRSYLAVSRKLQPIPTPMGEPMSPELHASILEVVAVGSDYSEALT